MLTPTCPLRFEPQQNSLWSASIAQAWPFPVETIGTGAGVGLDDGVVVPVGMDEMLGVDDGMVVGMDETLGVDDGVFVGLVDGVSVGVVCLRISCSSLSRLSNLSSILSILVHNDSYEHDALADVGPKDGTAVLGQELHVTGQSM